MAKRHEAGVESAAAVMRLPVHPLLVPLPITAFLAVFCSDLINELVHRSFWSLASFWLLIAGLVTGGLAAIAGFIDYMAVHGVRSLEAAQVHAAGNFTVLIVALCNLAVRWFEPTHFHGWPIALSVITVGLLTITGWLGGNLAYKHRIGQVSAEHGGENPARIRHLASLPTEVDVEVGPAL